MLLGAFGSGRKEILARTPARDSCRPCRRTADRGTNDAGGAVGRSTVTRPSDHASADGDPDPVPVPWSIEKRRTQARVIGRRGPSPTGTTRAASRAGPRRKTATGRRVSPRKRRGSAAGFTHEKPWAERDGRLQNRTSMPALKSVKVG